MDKIAAIYVADLIEAILRAEPGTAMGNAREEFFRTHGAYAGENLFMAERDIRKEFNIPDSTGKVDIQE